MLALTVLACVAYAIWVGVTHGTRVIGVVIGIFVLLIGLLTVFMAIDKVALRLRLARHGVTVDAERVGRSKPLYYYNDAAGVPHQYSGGSGAPTIPVTYDPRRPDQALHRTGRVAAAINTTLTLTAAGLLLLAGAWLSFGLLR
ncbi:hypothetical protein ACFVJM_32510 [Streptomyces virginiae]|uniref:hypothetical protein n=1 Tax=Streptomyces virginiae TaxID=1961 RepID=UPI00363311F6